DPTLVVDVTPIAPASVSGAVRWDNDIGGAAWLSLRQRVSLNTPVEFRLSGTIDELRREADLETSFFSALVPGLRWNGGLHAGEEQIREFGTDTVTAVLDSRRFGARAGAEIRGPVGDWFLARGAAAGRVRGPATPEGWAIGPVLRLSRPPRPDRVTGVDPLFEVEVRGGDIDYHRGRLRAARTVAVGYARAAALLEIAVSSAATPLDARPFAYRDMAPWLPAGAFRSRHQAVVGIDGAVPVLMSGYVRVRLRAFAAADEAAMFDDENVW